MIRTKNILVAFLIWTTFLLPVFSETEQNSIASSETELVKIPGVEFSQWLSFKQGDEAHQLLWLSEANSGVLDGPFQGPMAFVTDRNGNLWVGDTLNARITAFTPKGRMIKSLDLIKVARAAGLASDPVLVDMVPGAPGKLLAGDVANNAIIEIDLRNGQPRAFSPAEAGDAAWQQINRLHSDNRGNIYVEDVAMRRTVVLDKNGKAFGKPLEGQIGLAIARDARTAILAADDSENGQWQILTAEKPGGPLQPFATLRDDEPIIWAALQGYDRHNRLHVIYDTPSIRLYLTLARDGSVIRKYQTNLPEPGYDPTCPDWVDANGQLYTVKIASDNLNVLTLK